MAAAKRTALSLLAKLYPDIPRERLMAQIVTGRWLFGGHKERNPKALLKPTISIEEANVAKYVSRGGIKLEHALIALELTTQVDGKTLLDVGASTGGFTDCLLTLGASLVYACDVGSNQLDWRLRNNTRVQVYEQTNAMDIPSLGLEPTPDWAVADIAFRSSVSVVKALLPILREHWMFVLIKPQFEWLVRPKDYNGVVPAGSYREILEGVGERLAQRRIGVRAIVPSELRGRKQGNQEFFFVVTQEREVVPYQELLDAALAQAFS